MNKEKFRVHFRGKKMNPLEAELYLLGLELRLVSANLNEEEMEGYLKWEDEKFIKNRRVKEPTGKERLFKKDERQYLIEELESQIRSTRNAKRKIYCEKYGHKEMEDSSNISSSVNGIRAHVLCSRCDAMYEREPTKKELENASKKIINPFQG